MDLGSSGDISQLLSRLREGDKEAESQLISAVYDVLRKVAARHLRRERPGHTLQTTELVHEAYLRLTKQKNINWENRGHFFGVAAKVMRRILVDHARKRLAEKRGGNAPAIVLDEGLVFSVDRCAEFVELDEALGKLAERDSRASQVVELRCFGGMSVEETADYLNVSARTVKREWSVGRAWLRSRLSGGGRRAEGAVGAG